jgi:hypothetical protein
VLDGHRTARWQLRIEANSQRHARGSNRGIRLGTREIEKRKLRGQYEIFTQETKTGMLEGFNGQQRFVGAKPPTSNGIARKGTLSRGVAVDVNIDARDMAAQIKLQYLRNARIAVDVHAQRKERRKRARGPRRTKNNVERGAAFGRPRGARVFDNPRKNVKRRSRPKATRREVNGTTFELCASRDSPPRAIPRRRKLYDRRARKRAREFRNNQIREGLSRFESASVEGMVHPLGKARKGLNEPFHIGILTRFRKLRGQRRIGPRKGPGEFRQSL